MRNLGLHLKLKGKLCAASVGLLGVGEREPQPPVENHFTARKKVVWKWKISDTAVLGRADTGAETQSALLSATQLEKG